MFRLTFYLLAGIGLVMYYAPDVPPSAPPANAAVVIPKAPTDGSAAMPASLIEPRAAEPEPVASRKRPVTKRESGYQMVSFLDPVIIGPDGKIQDTPTAADTPKPEIPTPEVQENVPVFYVTGSRVNVRGGPSTSDAVLGSVEFAEAVQVLTDPAEPWVKIRIEGDGIEGFMSSKFLAKAEPQG